MGTFSASWPLLYDLRFLKLYSWSKTSVGACCIFINLSGERLSFELSDGAWMQLKIRNIHRLVDNCYSPTWCIHNTIVSEESLRWRWILAHNFLFTFRI